MLPSMPGETALALLDDVSDACAVFAHDSGECVWQNAAWGNLVESLQQLASLLRDDSQVLLHQQLKEIVKGLSNVPVRQSLRWGKDNEDVFETPLVLHPYEAEGQRLVAVLAMAPRPVVSLPGMEDESHQRDPLTGLPNRGAIQARLRQFSQSPSSAPPFALLFLDLDGFKQVNDQWGHPAGDRVLAEVAARLAGAIRERDLIARYGGDEFVVLVNGIEHRDELQPVLQRLRRAAAEVIQHEGDQLQVSASIGAALSSEGWASMADLINAADRRMYAEKQHAGEVASQ